ncbi:hypothetical protein SFC57_09440 [Niallia circulans]|nr:hypothetical protein [Niallia circulans]
MEQVNTSKNKFHIYVSKGILTSSFQLISELSKIIMTGLWKKRK